MKHDTVIFLQLLMMEMFFNYQYKRLNVNLKQLTSQRIVLFERIAFYKIFIRYIMHLLHVSKWVELISAFIITRLSYFKRIFFVIPAKNKLLSTFVPTSYGLENHKSYCCIRLAIYMNRNINYLIRLP